jgi:hypothetical protein
MSQHILFLDVFIGVGVHARPHPSPLPRGEGERFTSLDNFSILVAIADSVSFAVRHRITQPIAWFKTRRIILPLLGERAGVRADVIPDLVAALEESFFHITSPIKNIEET